MEATCHNCRWWNLLSNAREFQFQSGQPFTIGECRKHSPYTGTSISGRPVTKWPTTKSTDWCGDHALNLAMAMGRPSRAANTPRQNES